MSNLDLDNTDVVTMNPNGSFTETSTFQAFELRDAITKHLGKFRQWFDYGMECKVLRASGGGWKKGKLRLRLEFIPDVPEKKPDLEPTPDQDSLKTDLYPDQ